MEKCASAREITDTDCRCFALVLLISNKASAWKYALGLETLLKLSPDGLEKLLEAAK